MLFQERPLFARFQPVPCKVSINKELPDLKREIRSVCARCVSAKESRPVVGNVLKELLVHDLWIQSTAKLISMILVDMDTM